MIYYIDTTNHEWWGRTLVAAVKYRVKYAEHIILIPRREYIITGNQLDQLLKDIKRGKVECDGFKNTATLDFDNAENERITEIK